MSSQSGLSLLELLISLALLALVGAGLAGAFGLGTQLWTRTEALSVHSQEIALRTQLRRYMSQTLPPTRLTPFDRPFFGDQNKVSFITLADTPFAPDVAAMRMTLRLDGSRLRLDTDLLNDEAGAVQSWSDVLATKVTGLQISYWRSREGRSAWQPEWSDDATLPELIRIQIDEGSEPAWPDLIIKPQLQ